jgi:hypothetical protein
MRDLYLISTETLQYPCTIDRTEHGKQELKRGCIIKVGETTVTADLRVETLDGTFVYEKPLKIKEWINSPLTDKQVHKELEKRGFPKYREDRDREFFEFESQEAAIRVINEILFGTRNLKDYKSREEQIKITDGICNIFGRKIRRVLINAKMRSGKCHISYNIIKKMNFKKILILTYKPNGVADSWEDDIDHIYFKDFKFKRALNMNDVKFSDDDSIEIIFASFQDALGEKDGNLKDKWFTLFDQKLDLIIRDEDHYGYETQRSKQFLSLLNYDFELALSGTPFKAILDGKYENDEVQMWSYVEEQQKRNSEKNSGWTTEVYRGLPELSINMMKYDNKLLKKYEKYYKDGEKPTNYKIFSNKQLTYDFLQWSKMDPTCKKLLTNHMFWTLPRIENCDMIENVLKNHPDWKDYTVVNASGNSISDLEDTKNRIYTKVAKTITLSCGRWNTGSTVKEWSSVWMLDDGYSAENYFQTAFRPGTPWIINGSFLKENIHVVDFNSDRTLKCFVEYASVLSKYSGKSNIDYTKDLLECMPIYDMDGGKISKYNFDILMDKFNEIIPDLFGKMSLFDQTKSNQDCVDILSNINGKSSNNVSETLNDDSEGRGKNQTKKKVGKNDNEGLKKETIEDLMAKAKIVTDRVKNFLYAIDDKILDINDIKKYSEQFETHTGIDSESFIKLVNIGFISKEKIETSIEIFNMNESFLFE